MQTVGNRDAVISALFDSLDRNQDGAIGVEEFERLVQRARAQQAFQSESREAVIGALFDSLDRNRNGSISVEEFGQLVQSARSQQVGPPQSISRPQTNSRVVGHKTTITVHEPRRLDGRRGPAVIAGPVSEGLPVGARPDLDAIWMALDRDRNGVINRREFEAFRASYAPGAVRGSVRELGPGEVPFGVRPDLDAMWNALDLNRDGVITRAELEQCLQGQQAPPPPQPQPQPVQATMGDIGLKNRYAPPPPSIWKGRLPKGDDDTFEEVRASKDANRFFLLFGTGLLTILCILPFWSSLALLRSRTYCFFAGPGSSIGPIILFTVFAVAFWMDSQGINCGCPCVNPFAPLMRFFRRFAFVPTEAWVMAGLVVFLMVVWKVLPLFIVGGFAAVLGFFKDIFHVFDLMWFSTNAGATIMACCLAAVLMYVLSLNYFLSRARPEVREGAPYPFAIWATYLLLLGASFMMFSYPISHEAELSHAEIMSTCETGSRTRDLFITSQALQSLRQTPGCTELSSVEYCNGFQPTKYSNVLKNMERELRCSGFCYAPGGIKPLTAPASDAAVVPAAPAQVAFQYPPTLFTQSNFYPSCDGMAARNMQNFVGAAGRQIYNQGATLVFAALCLGMLGLAGGCGLVENTYLPGAGYGATL